MHAQNFFAALHVGTRHHDAAVEAAGPQQGRIEHVRPVGCRDQDHALVRFEAVHFNQQRVQRLLALVMTAAEPGATVAADRVNFVDEDDARRILLALFKEIAHAACAHADEHLHEVRTRNREERHVRFTSNGSRQQRFPRPRRSDQQHALGNSPAQLLELLRIFQELNNLLQLFLGLVRSRHVLECRLLLLRGKQPRAGLSETQRLVSTRLHLAHQEQAESHEKNQRCGVQENQDPVAAAHFLHLDLHSLVTQCLGDVRRILLRDGYLELSVGGSDVFALKIVAVRREVHRHFFDVALFHLGQELAIARLFLACL